VINPLTSFSIEKLFNFCCTLQLKFNTFGCVGLVLGHLNSRNSTSSAKCVLNWGALNILLALTEFLLSRPTTAEVVVYTLVHVHSLGWMEGERSQCRRRWM